MSASGAALELLPASARRAVPWKNGGGITREIACEPPAAGLEDFVWRVSSAEVARAGPFSAFAGVERTLCVLEGELTLEVHGRAAVQLGACSEPFVFPGDVAAHGIPRDGTVLDLNVMTRRDRCRARVTRVEGVRGLEVSASTVLLFALRRMAVAVAGRDFSLEPADALRVSGASCCELQARGAAPALYLIELRLVAA